MSKITFAVLCIVLFAFVGLSHQEEYSEADAKQMASGSFAAYCPENLLEKLACGNNCDNLRDYEFVHQGLYEISFKHSVSFTIFASEKLKRVMVAFRGTNSLVQLTYEAAQSTAKSCAPIGNTGKVGSYFCYYYDTYMQEDLIEVLEKTAYDYEGYDYFITGHSLGGAFATLAALDISQYHPLNIPKEKLHLYTFGSPRVGDLEFVNTFNQYVPNAFRVTHNKDLVPHIPPNCVADAKTECTGGGIIDKIMKFTLPKFQSYHLKPEIFYAENTTVFKACDKLEDSSCSNQFHYRLFNVADHRSYLGLGPAC